MFNKKTISLLIGRLRLLLIFSGFLVSCSRYEPASSAYVSKVFDYVYSPGQESALVKMTDIANFIGEPSVNKGCLHLGGFGGYVIAGFDHNVENGEDVDFEIFSLKGDWPEPGVVYVMSDTNNDGKPNDTWYELKGNQYKNSLHNYWVTYYRNDDDSTNIAWLDSKGSRGELVSGSGSKYTAGWWWSATKKDSVTFTGTRLPDAFDQDATGRWFVPRTRFTKGYAKNVTGADYDPVLGANSFDISNAVDSLGYSVELPNIRFIKVQTGVFQRAGWINEVSTDVLGAKDLRKE